VFVLPTRICLIKKIVHIFTLMYDISTNHQNSILTHICIYTYICMSFYGQRQGNPLYRDSSPYIQIFGFNPGYTDNDIELASYVLHFRRVLFTIKLLHKCFHFLCSLLMPYRLSLCVLRRTCRQG
jgi:hypothetical protein